MAERLPNHPAREAPSRRIAGGAGGGGRGRPGPSPSTFWLRRVGAALAIVVAAVVVWFLIELFQPFHGAGHGRVAVTVPKDAGSGEIASILVRDGVVQSGFFFKLRATLDGDRGKLLAGSHLMKLGMSYAAALKVLTTPPPPIATTNVTIIPGRSRQQIDELLRQQGVKGSYLNQTRRSKLLDPKTYGGAANTPSLEGFLFPDTYNLRTPVKIGSLVADQLKEFRLQIARVNFRYAESKNLTPYDVLKIASLIQEESYKRSDGPKVASVIYNRLRLGMDLGLDSTVAYATGNYGTLTAKDLASSSPWNTTNHAGLPPTPIDSPDLTAIQQAAHPAKTDYLYFIDKVCGNGALRFTSSFAQFERWSALWSAASVRAARTKSSPEFCKTSTKSSTTSTRKQKSTK